VIHVRLEASPVKPQVLQNGLYLPAAPDPVNLEITVARIRALVGDGRVGSPELLDTHRPDAFRMVSFGQSKSEPSSPYVQLAMNLFRPPRPAHVTMHDGEPIYVSAQGLRGKVIDCAGPWTSSGDWWTDSPWSRDEWDVALSDGALYRIYFAGGWYVGGIYD
jgi:protein ImuB